ncbi:hypothetical protein [Chryseobacterium sp. GP-SGM7]|uniref:hypothetical protein n=1 Tax=Chryseobacterium sp. GP-SGM7 TaxID=3411323 RepID=UPI003B94E288
MEENEKFDSDFSTEDVPISDGFWNYMENYWHNNREFPESTQSSLNKKADLVDGKVPSSQLPSYVDDVVEFESFENLPNPGEKGKIYLVTSNNAQFRWGGSEYIKLNSSENLMTTDTTQGVYGVKEFYTNGGSSYSNTAIRLGGDGGNNAVLGFNKFGAGVGTIQFNGADFFFTNQDISAKANLISSGFIKDNSDNNKVLLGGGGDKLISDFVASKIINGSYNANNLSTNSITYGYSVANAPTSASSHSFTTLNLDTADSNYKMQLGFDADTNEMFSRIKFAGNWNDWIKYATTSQLGSYVSKAGDTMTGDLIVPNVNLTSGSLASSNLTGYQILASGGNTLYVGNTNGLKDIRLESENDIYYFKTGVGNAVVWTGHNFNPTDYVNKSGDTITDTLIINSPDSIGSNNLGTLPQNTKLFLANGNGIAANYGTVFWSEGTGGGYIQQQRADGQQTAYPLNLQPYGGDLFYGNNEVATVNQLNNKVNNEDSVRGLAFDSGSATGVPYFIHINGTYVPIATQTWINNNYPNYLFLAQNYALRTGSNATDTWVNSALGLTNNPYIPNKIKDASGNDSYLQDATYGSVMGMVNTANVVNGNPRDNWFHRVKMLHNNSSGYYTEIGVQMTAGNSMWYKRYEDGTDYGWIQVWDKQNLTQAALNSFDEAYGWGNHALAGYLTSLSLNGYATQSWVQSQNYITPDFVEERLNILSDEITNPDSHFSIRNKFTTIIITEEYNGEPLQLDDELIPESYISIINLSKKIIDLKRFEPTVDRISEQETTEYYINKEHRLIKKGSYKSAQVLI